MKKLLISSVIAATAAAVNAAPLVTIGDQLDVFFRGAFTGKWDSNVTYSTHDKINDYAGVFRLGAEADYGRNSKFKANVKFFEDLTRYAEHKEFNSNLAHVAATAAYVEANWSVNANFSFDQNYQNTNETLQSDALVRSDAYKAGIVGNYNFTDKIDGEIGFNWNSIQYTSQWSEIYSDNDIYSVPVSLLYRVTEKVMVGLTYSYRHVEFSGGSPWGAIYYGDQRDDHFGGITVRGELLPKLSSTIFFGATYRSPSGANTLVSPDGNDSDVTFTVNANFNYELTEKIGLFANAFRDFGNGAQRQSSINTGCEVGANYAILSNVTLTSSFSYVNYDYQMGDDREDDNYIARFGVSYIPNKFITLGANYRYLCNSSNVGANYNQHLVDFTVMVKY